MRIPLKSYHTFGMDVWAEQMHLIDSEAILLSYIDEAKPTSAPLILGGGSNILFTKDIQQPLLKNEIKGYETVLETDQEVHLKIGGGEIWHQVVQYTLAHDWGGIENLSLIPGTAGAAPIQNIGAYGIELKDVFVSLEAIHLLTGEKKTFPLEKCAFGYRDSVFKSTLHGQYFILNITLRLQKQPHTLHTAYGDIQKELSQRNIQNPTIQQVSEVICHIRSSKLPDPTQIGNAGSFFKNPLISLDLFHHIQTQYPTIPHYPTDSPALVKVPAGWLIEQCGWKGEHRGTHGVHSRQALVLVNYGGASGADIWQLSEDILRSVRQTFGILLEREVNIW